MAVIRYHIAHTLATHDTLLLELVIVDHLGAYETPRSFVPGRLEAFDVDHSPSLITGQEWEHQGI